MSNWADLPGDILNLILSNIFGEDMHNFSLVCRHWNAVTATSPYRDSPCLVYYYRRTHVWKFCRYNTVFNMIFPELENAEIRCSKYGWLLMSRYDGTIFFFDPSYNRKVKVPCKIDRGYTSLCFFNPPTSPECVIVGIKTPISKRYVGICTLKLGEDNWESMEYPTNSEPVFWMSLGAPVLHHGLIYFLSVKGDVATLDIERGHLNVYFKCISRSDHNNDIKIKEQYLVRVNGEDALFGVFVFDKERKVNVFRLSSEMKWDSVASIGDKVLYVSLTSSFGCKAHTKSMENTIYFPKLHGEVGPVAVSIGRVTANTIRWTGIIRREIITVSRDSILRPG